MQNCVSRFLRAVVRGIEEVGVVRLPALQASYVWEPTRVLLKVCQVRSCEEIRNPIRTAGRCIVGMRIALLRERLSHLHPLSLCFIAPLGGGIILV